MSEAIPLSYQHETFEELEKHLGSIEKVEVKSIRKLIGRGYDIFWSWQGRYRVLMGS